MNKIAELSAKVKDLEASKNRPDPKAVAMATETLRLSLETAERELKTTKELLSMTEEQLEHEKRQHAGDESILDFDDGGADNVMNSEQLRAQLDDVTRAHGELYEKVTVLELSNKQLEKQVNVLEEKLERAKKNSERDLEKKDLEISRLRENVKVEREWRNAAEEKTAVLTDAHEDTMREITRLTETVDVLQSEMSNKACIHHHHAVSCVGRIDIISRTDVDFTRGRTATYS